MNTDRDSSAEPSRRLRGVLTWTLVSLLASAGMVAVSAAPASAVGPAPHYLMTAFTRASQSNMNIYDSSNSTNWNLIKANAYTPPSGLIRDPSIMRHTDGFYYIVYTTNWTGDTIGFARSVDHVNWTFLRNVRVGLNGSTGSTWAPECRDATFSIGAGLANSNCYSLQAVSPTGHYLRHLNNRLTLAANDGSARFRSDATFCGRTGLAGGGTISFESYNYPGFYLRHSNYELRIDPRPSTTTFNGDASFTVTAPLG